MVGDVFREGLEQSTDAGTLSVVNNQRASA